MSSSVETNTADELPDAGQRELELVVCWQDGIKSIALPASGEVTLGRAEDNHVRLDYPAVSRRHAVLRLGPKVSIEDLGGTNGTFVRDNRCAPNAEQTLNLRQLAGESAEIAIGETFALGAVTLVVRRRAPEIAPDLEGGLTPVIRSRAVRSVYDQAERAAQATIAVLILGETGVGKELLARAIHARSPRSGQVFMSINCAALSETLLEAELFGHERGAFTGALQARAGLFEAAQGGTVFLDEVGELSPTTQAKLLRVLEEGSVMRVGAREPRKIDVRFIAATNRDLEASIAAGQFRKDLFFRLNGICLTLPPLRDHVEDVEPLASAFIAQACRQLDRATLPVLSPEALSLLRRYAWPGNVRELRNAIERAVVLSSQPVIETADLPAALVDAAARSPSIPAPGAHDGEPRSMRDEIRSLERSRILAALEQCAGNQTRAAKLLGISRRTLITRLGEYGLLNRRKSSDGE